MAIVSAAIRVLKTLSDSTLLSHHVQRNSHTFQLLYADLVIPWNDVRKRWNSASIASLEWTCPLRPIKHFCWGSYHGKCFETNPESEGAYHNSTSPTSVVMKPKAFSQVSRIQRVQCLSRRGLEVLVVWVQKSNLIVGTIIFFDVIPADTSGSCTTQSVLMRDPLSLDCLKGDLFDRRCRVRSLRRNSQRRTGSHCPSAGPRFCTFGQIKS